MRANQKTLALWVLLLIGFLVVYQTFEQRQKTVANDFNFSKFVGALDTEEVQKDSIVFRKDSGEILGKFNEKGKETYKAETFLINGNTDDEFYRTLTEKYKIIPNYEKAEGNSFLASLLINWLPFILFFLIFLFFMRQLQAGGGKAMSFGKSKAKLLNESKHKVTFKDVAGVEECKDELQEIVDFLKDPKKFTRLGGRIPKGVLLAGSPGTGKTLLARAVAGEAGVPFFSISGSDFVEMFVGVGASRVRDLFEQGKKNAPCIIFIDEIDAVGRHRGAGMGGGHDEREQTLDQLLVEMDGFEANDGVIIIAATNRPDILDPALLRPGRFDRRVMVPRPDVKGREEILKVHTRKTPLAQDVVLKYIAAGTPGFTGAELESLVNEAALSAARQNKNLLTMKDFEYAKDKVIMGGERRSMVISEKDRKVTAYHEAGHTIVAKLIPNGDPVNKVTIIPRGMALGFTQIQPAEDALNYSKSKAMAMLAYMFGGRIAEELVFKDITSGASNDIERATDIARRMVCEWGMSDKLGPIAYEKHEGPVFVGLQQSQHTHNYSDEVKRDIDIEMKKFIDIAYADAKKYMSDNIDKLHTLSLALLELETLDGKEIDLVMEGKTLADLKEIRARHEDLLAAEDKESQRKLLEKERIEKLKQEEDNKKKGTVGGDSDPVVV